MARPKMQMSRQRRAAAITALVVIAVGAGVGLAVAGSGGHYVAQLGGTVPSEKSAAANRALPAGGPESSARAPVPTGHIRPVPAVMLDASSPPISPSLVRVKNGWMVSNGKHLVAVYAGEAGDNPSNGRFVIIRQNLEAGTQDQKVVTVKGTGAITITTAPLGPAVVSTAQHAQLGYRGASGARGRLDLATDTVGSG